MKSASMFPRYLSLIVCHFDFSCVADSAMYMEPNSRWSESLMSGRNGAMVDHGAEQSLERIVDVEVDTGLEVVDVPAHFVDQFHDVRFQRRW